jgi:hypothetical protein
MEPLEHELHRALSRKDPPAGFAERIEAAAARPGPPAQRPRPAVPGRWFAVAASIVLLAGGSAAYRHHQGEVAKEQLMTAMKITAVKLNHIQARVLEVRQ